MKKWFSWEKLLLVFSLLFGWICFWSCYWVFENYQFSVLLSDLAQSFLDKTLSEFVSNQIEEKGISFSSLPSGVHFFVYQDKRWLVENKILISWFELDKEKGVFFLRKDRVKDYLEGLDKEIREEKQPGRLKWTGEKVVISQPFPDELKINFDYTIGLFQKNLFLGKKETPLIVEIKPSLIRPENLKELGLVNLLAVGQSDFSGSPSSRIHNIKLAAKKFNGLLIAPYKEFSFNEILGEIGPEYGYLPELVIKRNKVIPEFGGGVCQVSTTLFRAAVLAGLKITERQPHAFPVRYYSPIGFDATVYLPQPDLKFINNTDSYLFIQNEIKNNQLFFEIYGSKNNRKVEVVGPLVLEKEKDGSIRTLLIQKIYQREELIEENKFFSFYRSPDLYHLATTSSRN